MSNVNRHFLRLLFALFFFLVTNMKLMMYKQISQAIYQVISQALQFHSVGCK